MRTAIERLIEKVPETATVLDVGYGGLDGENTTNFLRNRFKDLWGLSKDAVAINKYKEATKTDDPVILGLYPNTVMQKVFDLLVLDTNIDGNLDFWSDEGLKQATRFLKSEGFLLTYVLTTDQYGDEYTQNRIRQHLHSWWEVMPDRAMNLPFFEFVDAQEEERRPEITWVLLRRRT